MLPDFDRAPTESVLLRNLKTRTFAEILIDPCEEDRTLRAVLSAC